MTDTSDFSTDAGNPTFAAVTSDAFENVVRSIRETTEALDEVSAKYKDSLATDVSVVYVEYVPADGSSEHLAPTNKEREIMSSALASLRKDHPEAVFVSFPGDEKSSGGCIAAGRGFFHINSHGGAEPCPFSPYSDINVRDTSLKDAAASPLFRALADGGLLSDDHAGGCVLYEKRSLVEALLAK